MRAVLAAVAVASLGAAAAQAQDALGVGHVPGITFARPAPAPQPPPGRPSPPPVMPGGGHHLPPAHHFDGDLFRAGRNTYTPRFDRRSRDNFPTFVAPFPYFAGPTYGVPYVVVQHSGPYFVPFPEVPGYAAPADARRGSALDAEPPLTAAPAAALPSVPIPPPKTLYVIPRCYAGDRPPEADQLPPGCDRRAMRVIRPRAS